MTFTITVSLCAFMLSLLGSRIIILAMRQRRSRLGYDRLPSGTLGAPPYSIQDGGIVLVFSILICLAAIDLRYSLLLSVLLLAAVTLLKKILPIPWLVQMLVQVLAIAVPLSGFMSPTFGGILPNWMDTLLTGALWLWFIHAFASMDRLEGLCASSMICVTMGLALVITIAGHFPDSLSSYSLVMMSAGCGFFWWNYPPAKITLGEVGSIPIGFLTAYLLIMAARAGYSSAVFLLPVYFVLDYTLSWIRSIWKNKLMIRGKEEYYYRRAMQNGRSKRFVVRSVTGMSLLAISLAAHAQFEPGLASFNLLLAYLSVFMLLGFFAHDTENLKGHHNGQ